MFFLAVFDILAPYYLWLKAFHVIAVIAWMAGLLYLPRLFVYHCEAAPGSAESERFKRMENRLFRIIMQPSMAAVWVFGILLAFVGQHLVEPWFHTKLLLVVILSGYQGLLSRHLKNFARDSNMSTPRFFRMINEIPAIIMIAVVILVVVKPF